MNAAINEGSKSDRARDPRVVRAANRQLMVTVEIDGANRHLVSYPRTLFSPITFRNYTHRELVPGGYPDGPIADFDVEGYCDELGAVLRTTEQTSGGASLDFEGGLYPWKEHAHERFHGDASEDEFRALVSNFFVRTLETARSARPLVQWGIYGWPRSWMLHHVESVPEIWAAMDILTPSIYTQSGADRAVACAIARNVGEAVTAIRRIHPKLEALDACALLWNLWPSQQPVPTDVLIAGAKCAEPWADWLVMWMHGGTEYEAQQVIEAMQEGGGVHEFLLEYRTSGGAYTTPIDPNTDPTAKAKPLPTDPLLQPPTTKSGSADGDDSEESDKIEDRPPAAT